MNMFKQPSGLLSVLFIGLSIFLAFLIIPFKLSFPGFGLATLFIIIGSLAYLARKKKTRLDFLMLSGIILLSLFLVIRANFFLNFLDILTIVFLGSYFLSFTRGMHNLVSLMISPFIALVRIIGTKNAFPYKSLPFTPEFFKQVKIGQHLPAIVITVILLLVVLPLLSYANPFFQKIVTDIIKILDLTWILKDFTDHFIIYVLRLLVILLLTSLIPRGVSDQREIGTKNNAHAPSAFRVNLLIPKIVLSLVLIVFFVTQLQLYFSSPETLKSLGYTNSQYAREVFAQLSVVAFIIFLLMYADRGRSKFSRYLTILLIIEGSFLCSIALKSVFDYTEQYGFTSKRLYGYAGVAWIAGVFALFAYHYSKNQFEQRFVKHIVIFSSFVVLCINTANFDYLIYHYAKPQVFGTDYVYLSGLSSDANSYDQQIPKLISLVREEKDPTKKSDYVYASFRVLSSIRYLQTKYENVPLGSFNVSEYQTFKRVKDVEIQKMFDYLNKQQSQLSVPVEVNSPSESIMPTAQYNSPQK